MNLRVLTTTAELLILLSRMRAGNLRKIYRHTVVNKLQSDEGAAGIVYTAKEEISVETLP